MRIAIIGGGPRGLWACERLSHWSTEYGAAIEVDLYEPGRPGAGTVYRSDQPEFWRLNVNVALLRTGLGAYTEWSGEPGDTADPFPPRRAVESPSGIRPSVYRHDLPHLRTRPHSQGHR